MIYKRDKTIRQRVNYVCGQYTRLRDTREVEIVNAKREPRPTCSHTRRIGAGVCRNEQRQQIQNVVWPRIRTTCFERLRSLTSCTLRHGRKTVRLTTRWTRREQRFGHQNHEQG